MVEIKIISGGAAPNTYVVDKATGERLKHVKSINWRLKVGEFSTATIEFINVEAELESGIVETTGLGDGQENHKGGDNDSDS